MNAKRRRRLRIQRSARRWTEAARFTTRVPEKVCRDLIHFGVDQKQRADFRLAT